MGERRSQALLFNDDSDLATPRRSPEFVHNCNAIEKALGNIVNLEKSFISKTSLICESYDSDWGNPKYHLLIFEWINIYFTEQMDIRRIRFADWEDRLPNTPNGNLISNILYPVALGTLDVRMAENPRVFGGCLHDNRRMISNYMQNPAYWASATYCVERAKYVLATLVFLSGKVHRSGILVYQIGYRVHLRTQ